ncbi:hypothetical protein B0T13DRAFT_297380 [Neurospora crassa]|nr:hypothetical protein B0T13DRAFT_297380 [Neurospora crassa]
MELPAGSMTLLVGSRSKGTSSTPSRPRASDGCDPCTVGLVRGCLSVDPRCGSAPPAMSCVDIKTTEKPTREEYGALTCPQPPSFLLCLSALSRFLEIVFTIYVANATDSNSSSGRPTLRLLFIGSTCFQRRRRPSVLPHLKRPYRKASFSEEAQSRRRTLARCLRYSNLTTMNPNTPYRGPGTIVPDDLNFTLPTQNMLSSLSASAGWLIPYKVQSQPGITYGEQSTTQTRRERYLDRLEFFHSLTFELFIVSATSGRNAGA